MILAFVFMAIELPPAKVGNTRSVSLMKGEWNVIPSLTVVFNALQEMTQSQQIEKDMAEAMSEVCILPLLEQGRFQLKLNFYMDCPTKACVTRLIGIVGNIS